MRSPLPEMHCADFIYIYIYIYIYELRFDKCLKTQFLTNRKTKDESVISDFRHDIDKICALLGYYAALSGNPL
jgi:hypothetical protein